MIWWATKSLTCFYRKTYIETHEGRDQFLVQRTVGIIRYLLFQVLFSPSTKKITERHGGCILVESTIGVGTKFIVHLAVNIS